MSAVGGYWSFAGRTVDHGLLAGMADALSARSPDGSGTWQDGPIGLVHAYLDTGSLDRGPPFAQLPGLALVFDGRIDDRSRLGAEIGLAGAPPDAIGDASLFLQAYRVWGEDCLGRVQGDFAFALWDAQRQCLFCARDRFGVRPFFYARQSARLLFSSDPRALLRMPGVPLDRDESALADFLLFGYDRDPAGSSFQAIRQLPPAHALVVRGSNFFRIARYWQAAPAGLPRYREPGEHVEHFRDLFRSAVADRVREPRLGILLSGGMDSTSVAACAAPLARLQGYTSTSEVSSPGDEEGRYASLAARSLGFGTSLHAIDAIQPFERWQWASPPALPPVYNPFQAAHEDILQRAAGDGCRVMLSGEGGDPSLLVSPGHFLQLFWRLRWGRLGAEVRGALASRGNLRGMGFRRPWPWPVPEQSARPEFPRWIDPALALRLGLRERWRDFHAPTTPSTSREQATLDDLVDSAWYETRFRHDEGAWTPIEMRYPFFDPRIVEFLMALPRFLVSDKWILRRAMEGMLPEPIISRRKTPFQGDLLRDWLLASGPGLCQLPARAFDAGFVDPGEYASAVAVYRANSQSRSPWDSIHLVAPVALAKWLGSAQNES